MNLDFTYHHQQGHIMEMGPRFKVSSQRLEKRMIDLAIPGMSNLACYLLEVSVFNSSMYKSNPVNCD